MAMHNIKFRPVALQPGNNVIRLSDSFQGRTERFELFQAITQAKAAIEQNLTLKPLPVSHDGKTLSPYADKNDLVQELARKIRAKPGGLAEQLFVLMATCTPIGFRVQDQHLTEAALEGYDLDHAASVIRPYPPRLMTPGELLSSERIRNEDFKKEVIPVKGPVEVYTLFAAVLRQMGLNANVSFLDVYVDAMTGSMETDDAVVSILISPKMVVVGADGKANVDLVLTSPNLGALVGRTITGVRVADDVTMLSLLHLNMADDAARMLNMRTGAAVFKMLSELGRGDLAMAIANRAPFYVPISPEPMPVDPVQLTGQLFGPALLGRNFTEFLTKFMEWTRKAGEEVERLIVDIGNASHNALELDDKNPFFNEMFAAAFSLLAVPQMVRIREDMVRFGHTKRLVELEIMPENEADIQSAEDGGAKYFEDAAKAREIKEGLIKRMEDLESKIRLSGGIKHGWFGKGMPEKEVVTGIKKVIDDLADALKKYGIEHQPLADVYSCLDGFVARGLPYYGFSENGRKEIMQHTALKLDKHLRVWVSM